jgi:hypothetical protein
LFAARHHITEPSSVNANEDQHHQRHHGAARRAGDRVAAHADEQAEHGLRQGERRIRRDAFVQAAADQHVEERRAGQVGAGQAARFAGIDQAQQHLDVLQPGKEQVDRQRQQRLRGARALATRRPQHAGCDAGREPG